MITISCRQYNKHIKSLVHFDFPYYNEPGDGLNDDILGTVWTRAGNVLLAGAEIPADKIITGTPKFGYRCLHCENSSQYIYAKSDAFALDSTSNYEFSFWLRPAASQAGSVLELYGANSQILRVSISAERKLMLAAFSEIVTTDALTLNEWHYVQIRIAADSMGILINGQESSSSTSTTSTSTTTSSSSSSHNTEEDILYYASLSTGISRTALPADEIRLGGFNGQLDEFMFSDAFFSGIPSQPHNAHVSLQDLGGTGSGALGDVVITSSVIINTTAAVSAWGNSSTFGIAVGSKTVGAFGDFAAGDEVMFLCLDNTDNLGKYAFRKIKSATAAQIILDKGITEFSMIQPYTKTQIIKIPHFKTLTIPDTITISPKAWANNNGGIIAFRVQGDCTIRGKLLTLGKGTPRTDLLQMTHSKLIDRFVVGEGGGIFIVCGGNFTLPAGARLGASWAGDTQGGKYILKSKGTGGGSGYGGGGGSDNNDGGRGALGGVGGGGGGGNWGYGFNAGVGGSTGGQGSGGGVNNQIRYNGGTQGINPGGNSPDADRSSGGGGAGGSSGSSTQPLSGASAGANLILLTKTLSADLAAISTGGEGGNAAESSTGGAGTGFAFIACEQFSS